jgi:arginine/lysine/ornithine decarboxylase
MRALDHIRILCKGDDGAQRHPNIFDYDPGKIVMSVRNTNLTGPILAKRLLEQYGIELEMALGDYAVAMTSICDTQEGFSRLGDALLDTDSKLVFGQQPQKSGVSYAIPESAMPIYAAQCASGQFVALSQSSGRISREYVYAYPPGVPMLVPGEVISAQVLEKFGEQIRKGVELKSTCKRVPHEINVIA